MMLQNGTHQPPILVNASEDTIDQLIYALYGSSYFPKVQAIVISTIYALIFCVGFTGNVLTCLVIGRNRKMQTTTNCYLLNLAVTDLLIITIGIPEEIIICWHTYPYVFGSFVCSARAWALECFSYVSILTITLVTVERFLAVCYPIKMKAHQCFSRVVPIIGSIWVVAICGAIPHSSQYALISLPYPEDLEYNQSLADYLKAHSTICNVDPKHTYPLLYELTTVGTFVLPMIVITTLYTIIGFTIRKSTQLQTNQSVSTSVHSSRTSNATNFPYHRSIARKWSRGEPINQFVARKAVVKMLVFFSCWSPFHVSRMLSIYESLSNDLITQLFIFSGVMFYTNCVANPILYSIMSGKFRMAFKLTMREICQRRQRKRSQRKVLHIQTRRPKDPRIAHSGENIPLGTTPNTQRNYKPGQTDRFICYPESSPKTPKSYKVMPLATGDRLNSTRVQKTINAMLYVEHGKHIQNGSPRNATPNSTPKLRPMAKSRTLINLGNFLRRFPSDPEDSLTLSRDKAGQRILSAAYPTEPK